jgi:hypothetical protein
MNRQARRKIERHNESRRDNDATAIQFRIQAAANEVQRLMAMLQHAQAARALACQIPVVPVEGEVSVDDDPNFFRSAAIEDFNDREAVTRRKLICAHEEFYLACEAADPADAPRVRVPSGLVTA